MPRVAAIKTAAEELQIDITEECSELLASKVPPVIAIGSSGGKDSDTQAILLDQLLDKIGFTGQRVLVHAHLGRIEHAETLGHIKALAEFLKWRLIITSRQKGDLLDRYEQRWRDNCRRYALLECVSLIGPFATPAMRFCTGELKTAPIAQALTKEFPGQIIISCAGLRAEESANRARKEIFKANPKLTRRDGTRGFDWLPILSTPVERIFLVHKQFGFPLHPQYARGNQRLSCSFCIMASKQDLTCGAKVETNHFAYHTIIGLEARSTFSYQANTWLGDIDPELLTPKEQQALNNAKVNARQRKLIESGIPERLRFSNHGGRHGWPSSQPSIEDCSELAIARNAIARLLGKEIERTARTDIQCLTSKTIYERYAELIAMKPKTSKKISHQPSPLLQQLTLPAYAVA